MCHNNILKDIDSKIYDYNVGCDNPKINKKLYSKVGFGRAVDLKKNLYSVRLYFSRQKGTLCVCFYVFKWNLSTESCNLKLLLAETGLSTAVIGANQKSKIDPELLKKIQTLLKKLKKD